MILKIIYRNKKSLISIDKNKNYNNKSIKKYGDLVSLSCRINNLKIYKYKLIEQRASKGIIIFYLILLIYLIIPKLQIKKWIRNASLKILRRIFKLIL